MLADTTTSKASISDESAKELSMRGRRFLQVTGGAVVGLALLAGPAAAGERHEHGEHGRGSWSDQDNGAHQSHRGGFRDRRDDRAGREWSRDDHERRGGHGHGDRSGRFDGDGSAGRESRPVVVDDGPGYSGGRKLERKRDRGQGSGRGRGRVCKPRRPVPAPPVETPEQPAPPVDTPDTPAAPVKPQPSPMLGTATDVARQPVKKKVKKVPGSRPRVPAAGRPVQPVQPVHGKALAVTGGGEQAAAAAFGLVAVLLVGPVLLRRGSRYPVR